MGLRSIKTIQKEVSTPAAGRSGTDTLRPHLTMSGVEKPKVSSAHRPEVNRSLHEFHLLLRSQRLYDRHHPQLLKNLDTAYESLRSVAANLDGVTIHVERGGLVVPQLSDSHLADMRGEMQALAKELNSTGIHTLIFARQFNVGELDTLAQLLTSSLLRSDGPATKEFGELHWAEILLERRVEGISINTPTVRRVDTVLASLLAALVAYGGNSSRSAGDSSVRLPQLDDLTAALQLLAKLTPPLESARALAPEEAARAIHSAMEQASRDTVRLLQSSVTQYPPREAEQPQPYLVRLSESLILEFLSAEFSAGALATSAVTPMFQRLADLLVSAGSFVGPHASQHLSTFANVWSTETYREQLVEKFWLNLAPREKSAVLRGPEVWNVPTSTLKQTLSQLAEAGADAPRREARHIVLNYARCLENGDPAARRAVAAGLNDLSAILESLWPNQLPSDLSQGALDALEKESAPETAALLAAFVETLGRMTLSRADYAGFELILLRLERAAQEHTQPHITALANRLMAQDRWLVLADAALANRPLDPVLPRLLQRDPERLLDRMTLLLTESQGAEHLPAMARLIRTIGVPVLNLLETRLYEARRQRVSGAIKILALGDPERLLRALPRALASWEWNLQDLAISELSRPANSACAQSAAFIFSSILADAHPLVVPMMIDQIGLAQEVSAVPQLMEIAAGKHAVLRDQFVRIKAIEALGHMGASEAAELLRTLAEGRDGLTYAEPSGLRAVAEDALAMLENSPSSERARAAYRPASQANASYVVPRRYTRVPLESALRAHIAGAPAGPARVKTISLGGAYLDSPGKLTVGDSIKLEVRSGLRKIHFTAVVRNIGPQGTGVEFVHMKQDDREKLRKLVQRNLKS